jgi:hypothetical protein
VTRRRTHIGVSVNSRIAVISPAYTPQRLIELAETHGSADDWLRRMEEYISLGMQSFIIRFSSFDQFGQVERFAKQVLPSL